MKTRFIILLSALVPIFGHSDSTLQDVPVSVIYNPVITITPDQYTENYPDRLPVKLIVNEKGKVDRVLYFNNTPKKFKEIVDSNMKLARFTPYLKQGVAVKSVVPFTVKFFIQTEYDYNSELGD